MSRRVSLALKDPKVMTKPRVSFPDELIFLDNIKENNIGEVKQMLRRASVKIDLNKINDTGLTVLHQAVLNNSLEVVKLLLENKANIEVVDEENWTPLHAAAFMNYFEISEYLIENGANTIARTLENERPIDLVEPTNLHLISLFLNHMKAVNPDIELNELNFKKFSSIFKDIDLDEKNMIENIKDSVYNELDVLQSNDFIRVLTTGFLDSCQIDGAFDNERFELKSSVLKYFVNLNKTNKKTCSSILLDSISKCDIPNESIVILKEKRLITKEIFTEWKEESSLADWDTSTIDFLDELFDFLKHQ